MMTRKDYVSTAEILHDFKNLIGDDFTFRDLIYDFSLVFQADNPRFSPAVFADACWNGKK